MPEDKPDTGGSMLLGIVQATEALDSLAPEERKAVQALLDRLMGMPVETGPRPVRYRPDPEVLARDLQAQRQRLHKAFARSLAVGHEGKGMVRERLYTMPVSLTRGEGTVVRPRRFDPEAVERLRVRGGRMVVRPRPGRQTLRFVVGGEVSRVLGLADDGQPVFGPPRPTEEAALALVEGAKVRRRLLWRGWIRRARMALLRSKRQR